MFVITSSMKMKENLTIYSVSHLKMHSVSISETVRDTKLVKLKT